MAKSDKPKNKKPTPTDEALDELSWEFPFVRTIKPLFIKEGKAVKNGWVAVAVIVVLTIYFTHSWTQGGIDKKLSETTNYFGG